MFIRIQLFIYRIQTIYKEEVTELIVVDQVEERIEIEGNERKEK